jgi:single-strand DNA-binding protein
MLNKVSLLGNVGEAPKISNTKDGKKIATFSLATSESWKDKNSGEKQIKTEWHRIVVYSDGLANIVERYVGKGSKLYVEGQLQTRKWKDKEGNDKYTTEIVLKGFNGILHMLDSKKDNAAPQPQNNENKEEFSDDGMEDIPF